MKKLCCLNFQQHGGNFTKYPCCVLALFSATRWSCYFLPGVYQWAGVNSDITMGKVLLFPSMYQVRIIDEKLQNETLFWAYEVPYVPLPLRFGDSRHARSGES